MKFVVATQDYVGLGFAVRLRDERHEVILACQPRSEDFAKGRRAAYERAGAGLVDKAPLSELLARRETLRDA